MSESVATGVVSDLSNVSLPDSFAPVHEPNHLAIWIQETDVIRNGAANREITLGEHRDLATDFDDQDQPVLVTVRRSGEKVPMEGLSDGTRDQLYLALRLAAIEIHVAQFGSVPVILDDILINSDDERAAATLKQLVSLASRTQVLFFTHHRHLASLAQSANASVVELQTLAVA